MSCRICLEDGDTINVCGCSGTQAHVHLECVTRWARQNQSLKCELCHQRYDSRVKLEPRLKNNDALLLGVALMTGVCVSASQTVLINALTCGGYHLLDLHLIITSVLCSALYATCWIVINKIHVIVSMISPVCWYLIFFATTIPLQEHCGKFDHMGIWFSYLFSGLFLMLMFLVSGVMYFSSEEEEQPPPRVPIPRQVVVPVSRTTQQEDIPVVDI